MKILSIETSCDETAVSVLEASDGIKNSRPTPARQSHSGGESFGQVEFKILGDTVASQIAIHAKYGGVFPALAKREHAKAAMPTLKKTLSAARLWNAKVKNQKSKLSSITEKKLRKILDRESELLEQFLKEIPSIQKPNIDLIAVTTGPGLEPALWVGINFARALGTIWNIPVVGTNHMKGHIVSVLLHGQKKFQISNFKFQKKEQEIQFPAISLLVSGGHTELVLLKSWTEMKKIGQTRDDAAGEAFDKVARILGLPYPGGPQIFALAEISRKSNVNGQMSNVALPRPMLHSRDYDFSFSGLKTAVLYLVRDLGGIETIDGDLKNTIAREFEDAAVEVLVSKTLRAAKEYRAKNIIVGGGVSANKRLREVLQKEAKKLGIKAYFPTRKLSTDNSVMIGMAGYLEFLERKKKGHPLSSLKAQGNLEI